MKFDGVDDYASLSTLPGSPEATITGWMQWHQFNYASRFFDFGILNYSINVFNFYSNNELVYSLHFGGGGEVISTGFYLQPDTWYYISMIVSNYSGVKLYLNGALLAQKPSLTQSLNNIEPLSNYFLGKSNYPDDALLNGVIDEVRIYNRALSASEILQLYNLQETTDTDNDGIPDYIDNCPTISNPDQADFKLPPN